MNFLKNSDPVLSIPYLKKCYHTSKNHIFMIKLNFAWPIKL